MTRTIRPPSARGRWRGQLGRRLVDVAEAALFAMFLLILAGMFSLVLRFRRAGPMERRQLTWFLYATALIAIVLVLDGVLGVLPTGLVGAVVNAVALGLLPVAVGVAVFRYRLYEIDRIVSRTVSYGAADGRPDRPLPRSSWRCCGRCWSH